MTVRLPAVQLLTPDSLFDRALDLRFRGPGFESWSGPSLFLHPITNVLIYIEQYLGFVEKVTIKGSIQKPLHSATISSILAAGL